MTTILHQQPVNNIKELLTKVAEGNEKAFRQVFDMYHHQLGEFIMRLTESERITQEIVQDVFLKIWINRSALAEIDCFKAYLFVVAKNHAFNCLKQIAREKMRQKEWVDSVVRAASIEEDEEENNVLISINKIDEAVSLLPPQQQKVYLLSRMDGMRQQAIASELNISLETVKKHMVLALRFLKNHLRTNIGLSLLFFSHLFK